MDRSAATGVARSEANQSRTSSPVDVGDLPSLEAGQDLVLQVAPVDIERSRLPEPSVPLEHGLGDGLEEGLGGIAGRVLSTPDRGERSDRALDRASSTLMAAASPTIFQTRSPRCWQWTKKRLRPEGRTRTPKPPELAVADIVGGPARPQRLDAGVGQDDLGHEPSPDCGCSRGSGSCAIRSAATIVRRKNDPLSDRLEPKVRCVV